MTINLTLPPAPEQHLRAASKARQLSLQDYLLSILESAASPRLPLPAKAGESDEDFVAAMMSLSRTSNPVSLPEETWSRETICQDHD